MQSDAHIALHIKAETEKKMKFHFPVQNVFRRDEKRKKNNNKQLRRKTAAELCIRQNPDQGKNGFNHSHMKQT